MKCILIIPAWTPDDLFPRQTAGAQINYWQPLGTLYVAACLLRAGHEVRLLNGAFLSHEKILQEITNFSAEVAGIYSTTFGWPRALQTAIDIKNLAPSVFVCVGGPFPSAQPYRAMQEGEKCIDAVIVGEGEITLPEMVGRLSVGKGLRGIKGVYFREDGQITENPPRPFVEDLDSLPFPARELLGEVNHYIPPPATYMRQPVATMMTSRGCDRRCIFCYQMDRHRQAGIRGIRYRSIENVMVELEVCLQQGYREIKFLDDSLAADRDRLMELTRKIRSRQLDFTWFASACVNQVDKPLLESMKKAGCWAILLGAESGVQKNLNVLKKGTKLEQIRQAVKAAKDVGLKVSTPFLFGIPGETYEEALQTIDFAIDLEPDLANFHALTAFPGTELYDSQKKYGAVSEDLQSYSYQGASFVPFTLNRNQIQELRQLALRRFYSRPMFLLRRLMGIRTWHDVRVALLGLRSLLGLWTQKRLFNRRGSAIDARQTGKVAFSGIRNQSLDREQDWKKYSS